MYCEGNAYREPVGRTWHDHCAPADADGRLYWWPDTMSGGYTCSECGK